MADNRQFTDHNEIGGVNVYLEDKKLSEKTSQSSVASTDFVLLEDTDGAYHKIAKASFVEAIREALGSIINSVAKGTNIAKMPVLDSNNDLGMGTLANIGSALNVKGWWISNIGSTGEVTKYGFGEFDGGGGTLISAVSNNGYGGQIRFDFNTGTLYARKAYAGNFGEWKKVVDF